MMRTVWWPVVTCLQSTCYIGLSGFPWLSFVAQEYKLCVSFLGQMVVAISWPSVLSLGPRLQTLFQIVNAPSNLGEGLWD